MSIYKDFAISLASQAGKIIRENHKMGMAREWKGDDTPLTVTDKKVNQLVMDAIEKNFPEHSMIGEEGNNLKKSEYAWICDPVDGTVPFSHGWPTSVFALALTKKGESVLGIIYDPYMDRLAIAEKGKGTLVNNKPVAVSTANSFRNTVIDIEAWVGIYNKLSQLHEDLISKYCHTSVIRSTSYAALLVACGEMAGIVGSSPNPWDGAAAKIIVEEAGGKVTDLYGSEQKYDKELRGILATNGIIHNSLLDLIKPLLPNR